MLLYGGLVSSQQAPDLSWARVTWSELELKAKKLLMTATARVELTPVPGAKAREQLGPLGSGTPRMPRETAIQLGLHSDFVGRRSSTRLWVDPADASAFERHQIESGKRQRSKRYRYASEGVWSERLVPRDKSERTLAPERWSDRQEKFDQLPAARTRGLSEPGALLYLISAAAIEDLEQGITFPVFTRGQTTAVVARGVKRVAVPVNFNVAGKTISGDRAALLVTLDAESTDGKEEFELLGLEGDIEIYLDLEHRMPLMISGRVSPVGKVNIRLTRATLR